MSRRTVLLNIDVQKAFVKERTKPAVNVIQQILATNPFDLIIQTAWLNDPESNFVSKLFYKECANPKGNAELVMDIRSAKVLTRRGVYSAGCKELSKLLHPDDVIYVTGLETDACVLATCYWLYDNNYTFHVVQDAVGTNATHLHEPTLKLMERNFGRDCLVHSANLVVN